MSRILVTGSRGTIGKPLVQELKSRGHEIYEVDLQHSLSMNRADVSEYRQLYKVFNYAFPEYVYHLAAEFGRINGEEFYEQVWKTNVIGTRNILELQKTFNFNLIFASSSEIYGELKDISLSEEAADKYSLKQSNDYAISKWVNELQIMNFEKRYGTKSVRLRFFNAYGPGEEYHPYRSVVCLFCYRALKGLPFEVYKNYHRVFMYIDDFIPTLANVCENFKAGEVYNIGGREYRSVEDLANIILEYTGANPSLVSYLSEDLHNVTNKYPNIYKARTDLDHNPMTTLEEGIPKTIDWMKEKYEIRTRSRR